MSAAVAYHGTAVHWGTTNAAYASGTGFITVSATDATEMRDKQIKGEDTTVETDVAVEITYRKTWDIIVTSGTAPTAGTILTVGANKLKIRKVSTKHTNEGEEVLTVEAVRYGGFAYV